MATNFGTKLTITWPPWKIIALFAPTLYLQARAIRWCHLNFSLSTPVAMATNFGTILTITRLPQKIIARCFHLSYFRARAMQWCYGNFFPEDPCCHGNQPFLFKDKIGCRLTRASNSETQLLGYITWQWDWDRYLVPQNVFVVSTKNVQNMWHYVLRQCPGTLQCLNPALCSYS